MEGPAAQTQRAPASARAHADLRAGAALLAAGFLFAAAGSALLQRAPGEPRAQLLAGLASQALFLCVAFGGARLAGLALPHGLALGRPRLPSIDLALLAVGFVCVSHALSVVLSLVALRETGTLAELDRIVAATKGPSRLLAFVAIGLAPALGEEILFRGLVQQLARPRAGAPGAVVVSSLAFAAIHLDPVHSPAAFALGLYLGTAALLGASVWTAALCHGLNNALSVLVPQLGLPLAAGPAVAWVAALGATGLALLGVVARREARVRRRPPAGPAPGGADGGAAEGSLQREAPPAD